MRVQSGMQRYRQRVTKIGVPQTIVSPFDHGLNDSIGIFRIALLIPLRGSAGLWAPSCIACAQVAVEELNKADGINGRQIELIMIDTAIENDLPVEDLVNSLIGIQSINAIVGMHISSMRERLKTVVKGRIPYVYTPLYEGGEVARGIFAIGETPEQQLGSAIEHLNSVYRPKKWALIGNDYLWPRVSNVYAKIKFRALGADLGYEKYVPFSQPNFFREIEEMINSESEAVLISLIGQDAVQFNRDFGDLEGHRSMIRLSGAIEENALLASGLGGLKRLFSSSSYFASLKTDRNAAFKEKYFALHGDLAPTLNTLGQSTYEGIHFLKGLSQICREAWTGAGSQSRLPIIYKSVRNSRYVSNDQKSLPIYLARADGFFYNVEKELMETANYNI